VIAHSAGKIKIEIKRFTTKARRTRRRAEEEKTEKSEEREQGRRKMYGSFLAQPRRLVLVALPSAGRGLVGMHRC